MRLRSGIEITRITYGKGDDKITIYGSESQKNNPASLSVEAQPASMSSHAAPVDAQDGGGDVL